jgi:two-component system heavy metal sensor histidine kinase CusS
MWNLTMRPANVANISLSTRVMLFVALAIGLSLLFIGQLVQSSIERHFEEQDAEEMQVMADAVKRVIERTSADETQLSAQLPHAISGHHGVFYRVSDRSGHVFYSSPGVDLSEPFKGLPPTNEVEISRLHTWISGGKSYRGALVEMKAADQNYRIVTAMDMDFHLHFLESFRIRLWFIMFGAGTFTLLASFLGVHQGHAPLRALSDSVRAIQTDRLDVRLNSNLVPLDLRDLVRSFNDMIGRLEEGFTRLSNFSEDIAHELRTPLANLITQTQVALSRARGQSEYRDLLYSNLEEQERLAKMVNDMLWLAKSDHGLIKPTLVRLSVAEEIQRLFDFFEALADEKQVSLVLDAQDLLVRADRDMLLRAVSNLLSNAIRHTPSGAQVTVRVETDDTLVSVSVHNPGRVIPAEHLPRIFDRFYRVDASRQRESEGAGLGLAIAKSIVDLHKGRIGVHSESGATTFTLWLPTAG